MMILSLTLLTILKIFVRLFLDQILYRRPMAHPAPFITQDTTDTGSSKQDQKIVRECWPSFSSKARHLYTIAAFATARPSL
jgi:hypothetical protein